MVCAPVRRDNPRALARELSLRTGAQTMLYLSLGVPKKNLQNFRFRRLMNFFAKTLDRHQL